ncbi:MAG TPA: SDR family NAD(P)-dependent oxidoreductase [Anaeromyxobacter sp.]|nr:SDR family NAD(P)-dependent oxidoreductase [Anaeromyxobacter sp.]
MKLRGKAAVITGGGMGIGAAIGRLFALEGARVALLERDGTQGAETARRIREAGGDCRSYVADVSRAEEVARAAAQIFEEHSAIDILVNNAGIWRPGRVVDLDEQTWDSVLNTNLKGIFLVSRHFLPAMMERGRGVVVNVASVAGLVGAADASCYAASKGGVVNLSRSMALDFAPYGVRVNCLCPGMTDTAQGDTVVGHYKPAVDATEAKRHWQPLARVGTPEDVAKAALYLASDDSEFMTGSVHVIDGGLTAQ